jgi:peroxiredoxin
MPRENPALRVGDQAPDFRLRALDGREIRLSEYRSRQHVLLIFFRGTW